MSATAELWRMGAIELAEAIRSKRASSEEVIEAHLRRIEEVNPAINAVVVVFGEEARDAAKRADWELAAGGDVPPLHGVPFTVKANIDVAGSPTTLGAKALADAHPDLDAPVVQRLRAAGAIPIRRTNLPTFGMAGCARASCGGRPRTRGTGRARRGPPVVGRRPRSQPGCPRSVLATTGSGRCAGLPSVAASAV